MALEQVGAVVGPQGGFLLTVTADHFLHLAVGVEQALLICPSLGRPAPKGSKEPVAPLTQVGREEGVQLLPVEEGRRMLGMRGSVAGGWPEVPRSSGSRHAHGGAQGTPGHSPPQIPLRPSQQHAFRRKA